MRKKELEEEFVTCEQALALKDLGFNESCFANFYVRDKELIPYKGMPDSGNEDDFSITTNENKTDTWVSAPLKQQAFRWFRDTHGLDHDISKNEKEIIDYVSGKGMVDIPKYRYGYTEDSYHSLGTSMRYEEAESACLDRLIEIVKKKEIEYEQAK